MKKALLGIVSTFSLAFAWAQGPPEEAPEVPVDLVFRVGGIRKGPPPPTGPGAFSRMGPRTNFDPEAMEMMRFLPRVAGRHGERIQEIATLLEGNAAWAGELPASYLRPEDEEIYVYLLFHPRSSQPAKRERKRAQVARILEERYGSPKAFHAIGLVTRVLTHPLCDIDTSLRDFSAMLAILGRHPSPESLRAILHILTPSKDSRIDERESSQLRTTLASQMAAGRDWLPILKTGQGFGRQRAVLDRLIEDVERFRLSFVRIPSCV